MAARVSSPTLSKVSPSKSSKRVLLHGLLGNILIRKESFPGIVIQVSIPEILLRRLTKSITQIQAEHSAMSVKAQMPIDAQHQMQAALESVHRDFALLRDITSPSQSVINCVEFICIALNSKILPLIQTVFPPSETVSYDIVHTENEALVKYPEYLEVISPPSSAASSPPHAPPHAPPTFDDRISTIPLSNLGCGGDSDSKRIIYLGGDSGANNFAMISQLGITHILNVSDNIPNYYEDSREITYMRVPIADCGSVILKDYFPAVFAFINNALETGGRILVHCFAGKSRSASFVIAYLMKYQTMSFKHAFAHVQMHRAVVEPNLGFELQLYAFEKTL